MTRWIRSNSEMSIGHMLWRFSGAAQFTSTVHHPGDPGVAIPAALFDDLLRLHLVLGTAASEMLSAADEVVRRTPGTVAPHISETVGYIEGAVLWGRTVEHQRRTGEETTFICRLGSRRYETLSTRIVKRALSLVEEYARLIASGESRTAREARDRLERARRIQVGKLALVRPVNSVSEEQLSRVADRPGMGPIVDFLELSRDALSYREPAVERVLSDGVIAPADDDVLYELEVGFRLVELLVERNFTVELLQAVRGMPLPFAVLRRGDDLVRLWYQRSLRSVRGVPTNSLYSDIRQANNLRRSSLIPDFILELAGGRIVVVEVKLTQRLTTAHIRSGLSDSLAYLLDTKEVFDGQPDPHAIVVAWDSGAVPSTHSCVAVAEIATLETVVAELVNSPGA